MSGIKRLRSVAHSFAQHALSPFSPFVPERNADQRSAGLECISINLVPSADEDNGGSSLCLRFSEFLGKEHLAIGDISEAKVDFLYKGQCRTPDYCKITIKTTDGKVIEDLVNEGLRRPRTTDRSS